MKKILIIDACVRRAESRTRLLLEQASETMRALHPDWQFETLSLMDMDLKYWNTESLKERDRLLALKDYNNPVFNLGRQFQSADGVIVAAPFWDLSIPAMLKVYIENISAEGVTFACSQKGLEGICRGQWMVFLTTRGGTWDGSHLEQGSRYMEAMAEFFGIRSYYCVAADGIDIEELDSEKIMNKALLETEELCSKLELK